MTAGGALAAALRVGAGGEKEIAGEHPRRAAVALNARTGEMIWKFNFDEGERGRNAARPLGRGLSYWTDGTLERILYVTPGFQLVCLDAKTGVPVPGFGVGGIVEMKVDPRQDIDVTGKRRGDDIGLNATPLVVGDIIVMLNTAPLRWRYADLCTRFLRSSL